MITRRGWIIVALVVPCIAQDNAKGSRSSATLSGQVNRAGMYELREGMRVADLIVAAGGFRDFADTRHIQVLRGKERLSFDWNAYIRGQSLENILLEPGDVIVVP